MSEQKALPLSTVLILGLGLLACRLVPGAPDTAATMSPTTLIMTPDNPVSGDTPETVATSRPKPTRQPELAGTPTPGAAAGTGVLRLIAQLPPELLGEVTELRVDSDGSVRVVTSRGVGVWRDGQWTAQLAESNHTLIGVDNVGRMWVLIAEEGDRPYVWDGVSEPKPAANGWLTLDDPEELAGRGVLTDGAGRVWLATNRDVRVFDGAEWSVFTLDDLGMDLPPDEYMPTQFTLEPTSASGQVWLGECTWGGPGPLGGGGVRWFEGEGWQGADSPTGAGCIVAIEEDSLERVWMGVDAELWRYEPGSGDWTRFAPPQAPDGYRFLFITEIVLDPDEYPWVTFPLCGGASCVDDVVRYRLNEGVWKQVGDIRPEAGETLVFDAAGTPWLLGGGVYRVEMDGPVEPPETLVAVQAVTTDAAGMVWLAGAQPGSDDMALWVLDPAGLGTSGCECVSR